MARLDYLDPEGEIADEIRARRGGTLRPLDQLLLHSPPLAAGWNAMLGAVRRESTLPDDLRELVVLRVAALNGASYEWDAHAPIARAAGVTEEQLEEVRSGEGGSLPERSRLVVDFTTALTLKCRVPQPLFDAARDALGERGVVELSITVGAYNMVSRFLTALDVDERLEASA